MRELGIDGVMSFADRLYQHVARSSNGMVKDRWQPARKVELGLTPSWEWSFKRHGEVWLPTTTGAAASAIPS